MAMVNGKLLAHQYFDTDSDRKQFLDECQVLKYDLIKWKKEFPDEVRKPLVEKTPLQHQLTGALRSCCS